MSDFQWFLVFVAVTIWSINRNMKKKWAETSAETKAQIKGEAKKIGGSLLLRALRSRM